MATQVAALKEHSRTGKVLFSALDSDWRCRHLQVMHTDCEPLGAVPKQHTASRQAMVSLQGSGIYVDMLSEAFCKLLRSRYDKRRKLLKERWVVVCFVGGEVFETEEETAESIVPGEAVENTPRLLLGETQHWYHLSATSLTDTWRCVLHRMQSSGDVNQDRVVLECEYLRLRHYSFFQEMIGDAACFRQRTWKARFYHLMSTEAVLGEFRPARQEAYADGPLDQFWAGAAEEENMDAFLRTD